MRIYKSDVRDYAIETLWKKVYSGIRYKIIRKKDDKHLLDYIINHPSDKKEYCSLYAAFRLLISWNDLQTLAKLYKGKSVDVIKKYYTECVSKYYCKKEYKYYCENFELNYKVKNFVKLRILDIMENLINENKFNEEHLVLLNEIGPDDRIYKMLINYIHNNKLINMCKYIYDKDVALKIISKFIETDNLAAASSFLECTPALNFLRNEMKLVKEKLNNILNILEEKEKITIEQIDYIYNELEQTLEKYSKIDYMFNQFNINMLEYILNYTLDIKFILNKIINKNIEIREYYEEKIKKIKKMFITGTIDEKIYKKSLIVFEEAIDKINNIMGRLLSRYINKSEIENRLKVLKEMYENGEITESEYEYMKRQLENVLKYSN